MPLNITLSALLIQVIIIIIIIIAAASEILLSLGFYKAYTALIHCESLCANHVIVDFL